MRMKIRKFGVPRPPHPDPRRGVSGAKAGVTVRSKAGHGSKSGNGAGHGPKGGRAGHGPKSSPKPGHASKGTTGRPKPAARPVKPGKQRYIPAKRKGK